MTANMIAFFAMAAVSNTIVATASFATGRSVLGILTLTFAVCLTFIAVREFAEMVRDRGEG